jgi:glycosyltransferase involved in cell wall biosynthesis
MPEPRVTFLMTTWNGAAYLRPAVDSMLAQTSPDFRALVVDDCSSDASPEIVASVDDPRIELVRLDTNRGQTGALNHGLSLVRTEWVARLDQDDLAAPQRLERQLAWIDSHPEAVAVGSWADYVGDDGRKLAEFRPPSAHEAVLPQLYTDLEHNPMVHSAVTFRTDTARAAGGYPADLNYAQDTALWLRLAARGQLGNVPEVLTYVRHHPGQTSGERRVALRQLSELLVATGDADRLLDLRDGDRRAWRRSRARIQTHLAIAAAMARHPGDAWRWLRAVGRSAFEEPRVLRDVADVLREGIHHRLAAGPE